MFKGKWLFNLTLLTLKGKLSLFESCMWVIARIRQKPLFLSLYGIKFNVVDHTFWGIVTDVFINEVYTPQGFDIKPDDIVIDIGAHKGAFVAFSATKKAKKVIAFEPIPENFASLVEMISINQLTHANTYQKGVGAETGKTEMFLSPISSQHTIISGKEQKNIKDLSSILIETLSLVDCIGDLEKVDFMKMDCEGAEINILLNANHNILSKIKKLSIEIHQSINSDEIQQLITHLNAVYPVIRTIQDKNSPYGYIYARQ